MARRIVELLGLDLANLRELSLGQELQDWLRDGGTTQQNWPRRSRAPRSSPGPRMPVTTGFSEPGYRYQLILRRDCGPLTAWLFGDAAIASGGGCTSVIFSARDDSELRPARPDPGRCTPPDQPQPDRQLVPGDVTAPCAVQTPPPNPTAAGPGDRRVRSSPSCVYMSHATFTEAVAPAVTDGLDGFGRHRYCYGWSGEGTHAST